MKHIDRASRPPGTSARLHVVDFEILRNIILQKSGIYFQDNKLHVLQSRILTRLNALGLDYYEDYVDFVIDPLNFSEVLRLIDAVTSVDTSFFRSDEQFACIKDQILPSLLTQKVNTNQHTLRIWSAACATGEEVFSLAMITQDLLEAANFPLHVEIIGSDVNTEALQIAECGLYKEKVIEDVPPALLNAYFTPTSAGYKLQDTLLDIVTFKRINLSDRTDMMRIHSVDLVLCANVLSSFSQEAKLKTLQAIYNCMNDEAYFMVGASETLFGLPHPFLEINLGGTRVFQKCV